MDHPPVPIEEEEEEGDADQMKKKRRRIEREWFLFCQPFFPIDLCYLEDPSYERIKPKELEVDTSRFTSEHLCSIGTCNGLLCLGELYRGRNPVYIIDPINNRFLTIRSPNPHPDIVEKPGFKSGLGYDDVSGVYKVLRLYRIEDFMMQFYTFCSICTVHPEHGAMGWRSLDRMENIFVAEGQSGVFFRGKLYFLVVGDFGEVLCFDVAKEKFSKIPGPAQLERVAVDLLYLALFEGKLVLLFMNFPELLFRIWSINDDSSWSVLFDVPFNPAYEGKFYHIKPLKHMPDGCLLMYDDFHGELISCDYRMKEPKHIILLGHLKRYDVFPFTPDFKFDVTTRGDGTVRLSEVQDEGGTPLQVLRARDKISQNIMKLVAPKILFGFTEKGHLHLS
ncbi:hypothetical protein QJS04_geneDACA021881 [Acorus gramineus]|uniref:F-box associated beta-propeller type 3 domain-containing protein n=1 Tax=Acorus gramineus TaxID=55184 RepID=A0AAV8ZY67_ACOGR|nr:hypothetical protein QJS04_geneDACA021881 [Acorus gramineus]